MPIYEFECSSCGHTTEVLMRRSDQPPVCESCGSSAVQRRPSTFRANTSPCPGTGMCERFPDGDRPRECPPGRCCGIGD